MIYRNFYLNAIIRVILIFLTSLWLAYEIATPPFVYTILFLGSILLLQTYGLIWYVNKTNRELTKFFVSLKDKDSSFSINVKDKGGSFRELAKTLNETADLIKEARIEKEKQFRYLQFVVAHIDIGLIAYTRSGKVVMVNDSALALLGIRSLQSVKQLNEINKKLEQEIRTLNPGEQTVIRMTIHNNILKLLIRVTGFKFQDENLKLVSLQDFRQELEEQEITSWQKLIRVMTHEIMNSVTPITTLTMAIKKGLCEEEEIKRIGDLRDGDIRDVVTNTTLIEERSKGLIEFVTNYRNISKIEKLTLSPVRILDLVNNSADLFKEELKKSLINIETSVVPEGLSIDADKKLLQQVLINLIKNAMEAVQKMEKPLLKVTAFREPDGVTIIQVTDNGPGIPYERLEEIFIPFFTTKKEGSGIGLSFSRQVMKLHKGSIQVKSEPHTGTTFILKF
jgi:nitrogen fixation/metabolism regulation signal transduction histidine kinase